MNDGKKNSHVNFVFFGWRSLCLSCMLVPTVVPFYSRNLITEAKPTESFSFPLKPINFLLFTKQEVWSSSTHNWPLTLVPQSGIILTLNL